jgi:hypothetical protein
MTALGLTLVASALLVAGCRDEPAATYDAAFQAEFASACRTAVEGDGGAEACGCWYERLSTEVPFDELPTIDELVASESPEDVVDPELYEWLADCVRAFGATGGAPLTAPPPPTVPAAATTTTALAAEG